VKHEASGVTVSLAFDHAEVQTPRTFEVSGVPSAKTILSAAWAHGAVHVDAVCVQASTRLWVPGLEDVVLDGASGKVRADTGVGGLVVNAAVRDGLVTTQDFAGEGDGMHVAGRHAFGFVGDAHELLFCTVLCRGPQDPGARLECSAAAHSATVEASFVGVPERGPLVRAAIAAAEHPGISALAVFAVGLLVVAAVLARRSREELTVAGSAGSSAGDEEAP
jgi:hypothetical protein